MSRGPEGHFSKENLHMANRPMKRRSHHWSSEKCKLKPQCDITSHLSEWLPSINQWTSVGGDEGKREHTCTVQKNANWWGHYGKEYKIFSKKEKIK